MGEMDFNGLNNDSLDYWICQLADKANLAYVILDANDLMIKYANDFFSEITKYSKSEIIEQKIDILSGSQTDESSIILLKNALRNSQTIKVRIFHYRKDGTGFWNNITVVPLYTISQSLPYYFLVMEDVTETLYIDALVQLEREVYLSLEQGYNINEIFEQICEYISTTFYKKNKCAIFLLEEKTLKVITQSSISEKFKKALNDLDLKQYLRNEKTARFIKEPVITTCIQENEYWGEFHNLMGESNINSTWSTPIRNHEGQVVGIFAMYFEEPITVHEADYTFLDRIAPIVTLVIQYLNQKSEILRLAFYDDKTGLQNVTSFENKLDALYKASASGVIYIIEATEYQYIVDLYGRSGGDVLLRRIADRLSSIPVFSNAIIARYTSSSIIMATTYGNANLEILREHIDDLIFESYVIEEKNIYITLKIGAATFGNGILGEYAIQQADTALSSAQKSVGTAIHFFDESRVKSIENELEVLTLFTSALKDKEFFPMLQPKVDVQTGEVVGFEALARWFSPEIGFVSPAVFIPLGEKTGNIYKVDRAILKAILAWQHNRKKQGKRLYPISVNISPSHFYYPGFVTNIEKLMQQYDVESQYITFEITESIELEDMMRAKKIINDLKALGIATSIDDFGVGYSSLGYLQELPFEEIKIDKSFTDHIAEPRMHAVVKTIIQLAADLNMLSVAEGVETEEQHEQLKKIGCNLGQGYYYYKPMKLCQVDLLLEQQE